MQTNTQKIAKILTSVLFGCNIFRTNYTSNCWTRTQCVIFTIPSIECKAIQCCDDVCDSRTEFVRSKTHIEHLALKIGKTMFAASFASVVLFLTFAIFRCRLFVAMISMTAIQRDKKHTVSNLSLHLYCRHFISLLQLKYPDWILWFHS